MQESPHVNARAFGRRIVVLAIPIILATLLLPARLFPQSISIYPTVLYPGMNLITITSQDGIGSIQRRLPGQWVSIITGQTTPGMRIITAPFFTTCEQRTSFLVLVTTISESVNLQFRVTDCHGDDRDFALQLTEVWRVSREDFGTMQVGDVSCREFKVETTSGGTSYRIDSVRSPSKQFTIRYTDRRPPLLLRRGLTYTYNVCFTATKPGRYLVPIHVFLKREQPAGSFTNFIVADTAFVTVIPAPKPVRPPVVRPRPPRPPPPVIPPPPPPVADLDTLQLRREDPIEARPDTSVIAPAVAEIPLPPEPEYLSDPTAFRLALGPNARSIGEGKGFVANYDVAGWLFGFGATDRLSLIGGFLYVPEFISYSLTMTAGGRYEFYRDGPFQAAVGAQFDYSRTTQSTIVLAAPFVTLSAGDDDARGTLTLGYSWRRHTPVVDIPFSRSAAVVGGGFDYRFAHHWKVVAEGYYIQEADFEPLTLGLRYFGDRWAIDAGVAANVKGGSGTLQVGPLVSYMYTW